jgi:multiple sugar transport system ATP-binding protein
LEGEGYQVQVPEAKAAGLEAVRGKEIVFGIRPENLNVDPEGRASSYIDVKVTVLEPLGDELVIYGEVGSTEVVAQLDPRADVKAEQTVRLAVEMEHMHAFDPETEVSVTFQPDE